MNNVYKRRITSKDNLKPIDKLRFTKGKQWYQLYCRFLYSKKYLTRYDAHIDLRKGTIDYWNVTTDRFLGTDIFNPNTKSYKVIISRKIRQRLSPLGVKFSLKVWNIKRDKANKKTNN